MNKEILSFWNKMNDEGKRLLKICAKDILSHDRYVQHEDPQDAIDRALLFFDNEPKKHTKIMDIGNQLMNKIGKHI